MNHRGGPLTYNSEELNSQAERFVPLWLYHTWRQSSEREGGRVGWDRALSFGT